MHKNFKYIIKYSSNLNVFEVKHVSMHKSLLYLLICPCDEHLIKGGSLEEKNKSKTSQDYFFK